MLKTINLGLQYGSRKLFEHVDLQFSKGNCYGVIGANGAGKSTFLKLLSGEIESTSGQVIIGPNERMSILKQNQNAYDNETVMRTVLSGHKRLIEIIDEKEVYYNMTEFTEADGERLAELEGEFVELDGWNAEADAETLLNGLGVDTEYHYSLMGELDSKIKVKATEAKMARGLMIRYLAENNITDIEKVKDFKELGFSYSEEHSKPNEFVFLKRIKIGNLSLPSDLEEGKYKEI